MQRKGEREDEWKLERVAESHPCEERMSARVRGRHEWTRPEREDVAVKGEREDECKGEREDEWKGEMSFEG